jgi:hypothetical protein
MDYTLGPADAPKAPAAASEASARSYNSRTRKSRGNQTIRGRERNPVHEDAQRHGSRLWLRGPVAPPTTPRMEPMRRCPPGGDTGAVNQAGTHSAGNGYRLARSILLVTGGAKGCAKPASTTESTAERPPSCPKQTVGQHASLPSADHPQYHPRFLQRQSLRPTASPRHTRVAPGRRPSARARRSRLASFK